MNRRVMFLLPIRILAFGLAIARGFAVARELTIARGLTTALGLTLALGMGHAFAFEKLALETLTLGDGQQRWIPAARQMELLVDPDDTLKIDNLLADNHAFQPVNQHVINLGTTDASVWVHLRLRAEHPPRTDDIWIMELAFARLARVDIFLAESGIVKSRSSIGYEHPMQSRELTHNFFAQPLSIPPGKDYDLYLNLQRKGGGIQVPLTFYRTAEFSRHVSDSNQLYGVYFGIMLAMLVYNLFLLMSVGNRAYFYYLLHILGTFTTFQILYGYAFLHWWPNTPRLNEYAIQLAVCLSAMAALLFVRHYVNVKQFSRLQNHFISVMLVIGSTIVAIKLLTQNPMIVSAGLFIAMAAVVMIFITAVCWRRGSRPAGFFLLAWTVFLGGAFLHMLTLLGMFPHNALSTFAVIIGSALEVLLLSLGLADSINSEKRARYVALQEKHAAIVDLKDAEARLVERALHSTTTGLPNRALLRNILEKHCAGDDSGNSITLVLVAMSNFHEFNKTLGHSNGDAILCLLAQRLEALLSDQPGIIAIEETTAQTSHIACIEGVTFAALLRNQDQQQEFARHLQEQIEVPFDFQGLTLNVNAAIGIALIPEHGNNAEDALRNAHIALEIASNSGTRMAIYSREMDPYNARRISMLAELRTAIEQDALQLHVQPQISLVDESVVGAEVLIRWTHHEYGFVPPVEFIPLAERTGVINPLTYWVCRKAFELSSQLRRQGNPLMLSINISARNLQATNFVRNIAAIAEETGAQMNEITMELTETAVMLDPEDAFRVMNELSGIGIRLSIDDFGTGYSSLSYLKQLPVDEIKIDRSFVKEMQNNNDDQVIVHTTLLMGHNLGLQVVAEGIEDNGTLQQLKLLGCDFAQGYHIARPMQATDFPQWLERYREKQASNT